MTVDISKILKVEGAVLNFKAEKTFADVENFPDVCEFLWPVKVEGTITNLNGVFVACAEGLAKVNMCCSRCLKRVATEVSFEVNENFSNTGKKEEAETFLGDIIDLTSVVSRSILINLPMKVVCAEDCKGLCSICGKVLNDGACECDTSYINPKFESLRSLFKLDEEV
ncbi:MAG: YceD family protein [Anaerotignaceae bacterium]